VRTRRLPGDETYHFRTYSSAGALYPVEVYGALSDGLYHFHPQELALRRLRAGDFRASLGVPGAAVLVLTGILWRTAWKYGARGYRHLYWDAGTMLANLLALAEEEGLAPRLYTGFVDEELNSLLGVDGEREAALALFALGEDQAEASSPIAPLELEVAPLSTREERYPEAYALHRASSLADAEEVGRYRAAGGQESSAQRLTDEPLEQVLGRRGSIRDFSPEPLPRDELAALLAAACAPPPADVPPLTELYLVVNAVEGLVGGTYRFAPPAAFELLREGSFRRQAGYLCLEQMLGFRAAAVVFAMSALDDVLGKLGNRGYRAAQLEAGIRVGRIYVGAFGRGWGATGSTFYDDDVSRFLAPELSPMLCVAVGRR
jgi:SagB-type dehydrogenase family enzyme